MTLDLKPKENWNLTHRSWKCTTKQHENKHAHSQTPLGRAPESSAWTPCSRYRVLWSVPRSSCSRPRVSWWAPCLRTPPPRPPRTRSPATPRPRAAPAPPARAAASGPTRTARAPAGLSAGPARPDSRCGALLWPETAGPRGPRRA